MSPKVRDNTIWILVAVLTGLLFVGKTRGAVITTDLEIFGFITGFVCVRYAAQEKLASWPVGFVNSAAFLFLFIPAGLYANVLLQGIYLVQELWGWWKWTKKETIANAKRFLFVSLVIVTLPLTLVTMGILNLLSWQMPFWDTLTTIISLIANYLLGNKKLECWYLWIAVDVIYIFLFVSQGLYLTSLLYLLFLIQCFAALGQWKQKALVEAV